MSAKYRLFDFFGQQSGAKLIFLSKFFNFVNHN